MGLIHPVDLDAWHASFTAHHSLLRRARNQFRSSAPETAVLIMPGTRSDGTADHPAVANTAVDVLVVLDSLSPSQTAALLAPVRHLEPSRVAILTTPTTASSLQLSNSERSLPIIDGSELDAAIPGLRCVLAVGNYMHLGALAYASAQRSGAPFLVVQHGIVTPFAPPLPAEAELLAWSEQDADFWIGGRTDIESHSVGGQLLHAARSAAQARPATPQVAPRAITYLGQLHGHELPRRSMARAARSFCASTGAVYRPHPSETDIVSRLQHRAWRLRAIRFDLTGNPLPQLNTSVVSVFSTGILEAAAAGIPAWVDFPDPPPWLVEIWQRYGMKQFGTSVPTEATVTAQEPARLIAEIIEQRAAGHR